jgi:holo-[acyl-carrier protein] synthase
VIYGIGTDLLEVARIEASLARFGQRFVERILGPDELGRYAARAARSQQRGVAFVATRFAAKEAVSKALGLGMRLPMTWRAAEIVNEPSGRPAVRLHGALAEFATARRLRLHVSITDERSMVMACAVAEVEEHR